MRGSRPRICVFAGTSRALSSVVSCTQTRALLPLLTTESAKSLPFVGDFLLPYLRREEEAGRLRPGVDIDRASEYLARAILSLIGAPGRWDLDDPSQVADLVNVELLGGIAAP